MRPALLTLLLVGLAVAAEPAQSPEVPSPVADAVEKGDIASVRALLLRKVSPATPQPDGSTALHWAALKDDVATARLLLAAGAPVDATTRINAITPLFMAARNGSAAMVEVLLRSGADFNRANDNGTTPLMMAAAAGNPDAVKLLLDRRANIDAREEAHGQTALMFAAALGRADAIRVLLARHADPDLTSFVAKILPPALPRGRSLQPPQLIPPGAATMGGQTALIYAAREGKIEAVRALLEGGASVNKVSAEERSARF